MKATSVMCPKNNNNVSSNGRITKRKDIENEEIQMYISKLKDLVPFTPKNRKLTKLEVIEHAIAYILDLQTALETHPAVNAFDAAQVLNQRKSQGAVSPRQPLGVRQTPNTILTPSEAPTLHITTPEKLSPSDANPLAC